VSSADTRRPTSPWGARVLKNPAVRLVLALLSIAIPFAVVATLLNKFVSDPSMKRAGAILLAGIVLSSYWAYVRIVERRPVIELSWPGRLREFGAGVLLGALLFCLTIGVLATVPGFILSGVLEEVVMRGIVFRIVEQSLGSWIALAISAAIFGLLHLLNPGATLLNAGAVMVEAGVLLAAAYMLTRRLWFCIGIHIAWNFTEGGVFSAAVSGGHTKGLLQAQLTGADWLTGGAFGAEGSVVGVVICTAAGIALLVKAVRKGNVVQPFWSAKSAALRAS
jgi:uncharacterized protein